MTDSAKPEPQAGWEPIWNSGDIPPRYRTLAPPNDSVVEWADTVPAGGMILDVGCGVGRHVIYLAGRGFRMAGVDISPTGIDMTQAACAERGIAFDGKVADLTAQPWQADTFDAALSTSTIHHYLRAGILQALAEVRRVLKPGGLFIADFPAIDTLNHQRARRQAAAGELTEVEPNTFVAEHPIPDDSDAHLPHHFSDEADLRDLLRDFEILKLVAALHEITLDGVTGVTGKWVVWLRKPTAG